jgi:hypothetical protein
MTTDDRCDFCGEILDYDPARIAWDMDGHPVELNDEQAEDTPEHARLCDDCASKVLDEDEEE